MKGEEEMANVNDKQDVGSPEPQETHAASGIGSWFAGVFLDPGATFGTIAASVELPHPKDASRTRDGTKWWVPFLIGLVIMAVAVYFMTVYALPDQVGVMREALADRGVPADQIEQQIGITMKVAPVVAPPVASALGVGFFFAAAGLAHAFSKIMGGKGRFRIARAVVAYSSLATVLGAVVKLPIMVVRESAYVEMGPSLFFPDLGPTDLAFRLLMQLDVFMIVWVVLMVIGLSVGYRITKGKAVVPAVVAWLTYALTAFMGGGPSGG